MSTKHSKFLALVLRHNPAAGNLTLDANGWAPVKDVLEALRAKVGPLSRTQLDELVDGKDNAKKRYAYNAHRDKIRASQGHSVQVDLGLTPVEPPAILYHGTKKQFLGSIFHEGLKPGSRQHVHLSADIETATIVANRRSGENVILRVNCMELAGHPFYLSENGVWLTDVVPPAALELV
jgi:putative RNA 2'-phosphotransferase